MMTYLRVFKMMLFLAILAFASQPTRAQITAYASGQGAVDRIEVGVEVRAAVLDRCGFSSDGVPAGSIDQPDFDLHGFSKDFAIALNCSSASEVAVLSRNGGMVNSSAVGAGGHSTAPYQVALHLVADSGISVAAECDASALTTSGDCIFAGVAGSNGIGALRLAGASTKANGSFLRVSAPAYSGPGLLAAGRFSDTLSVTVSVSP